MYVTQASVVCVLLIIFFWSVFVWVALPAVLACFRSDYC